MIFGGRFDGATVKQPQIGFGLVIDDVVTKRGQLTGHVFPVRVVVSAAPRLHVHALSAGNDAFVNRGVVIVVRGDIISVKFFVVDYSFVFLTDFWENLFFDVDAVGACVTRLRKGG